MHPFHQIVEKPRVMLIVKRHLHQLLIPDGPCLTVWRGAANFWQITIFLKKIYINSKSLYS
jgi:hypothetical protein